MLGVEGLDPFGLAHAIIGCAAVAFGLLVVLQVKGSGLHRMWGSFYVLAMVLLNASGLAIYDFTGSFNTFHGFALVSLATILAGWIPALIRRPAGRWHGHHAAYMTWSYVGLLAALVSEVITRVPFFRSGISFGAAILAATALVMGVGAVLIQKHLPRLVIEVGTREAAFERRQDLSRERLTRLDGGAPD